MTKDTMIAAIIIGDVIGLVIVFFVLLHIYKKRRMSEEEDEDDEGSDTKAAMSDKNSPAPATIFCFRLSKPSGNDDAESAGSPGEDDAAAAKGAVSTDVVKPIKEQEEPVLVMVDGETKMETDTLLTASAYILGGGSSGGIVYKAVLAGGGVSLAVRRIAGVEGFSGERMKDFEAQVRAIAKLRHPNLLRLRGFYWGSDEKLLIYDFAENGSLASFSHGDKRLEEIRLWGSRIRIARGVAKGLAFLHEKKNTHGNIKPSNILLDSAMEPMIGDFGMERLISGETSRRWTITGSRRSSSSFRGSFSEPPPPPAETAGGAPAPASSSYQPPESFRAAGAPNPKWDVYAFGVVLLELVAGRPLSETEPLDWNGAGGFVEEEKQVLRMADPALMEEMEGNEEALLSYFRLGFACASAAPQRRPTMKEALQVLEKLAYGSSSSSSSPSSIAV